MSISITYDEVKWYCEAHTVADFVHKDYIVTAVVDRYKVVPNDDLPLYQKVWAGQFEVESVITPYERLQWSDTRTGADGLKELLQLHIQHCQNRITALKRRH